MQMKISVIEALGFAWSVLANEQEADDHTAQGCASEKVVEAQRLCQHGVTVWR